MAGLIIYDALKPPTETKGYATGTYPSDGQVRYPYDIGERNGAFAWQAANLLYSQMRRDSQIDAILRAIITTLCKTSWRIDPANADEGLVRSLADSLGLPILGAEQSTTPDATTISWHKHLPEMLDCLLTYGHAPYEQTVAYADGMYRLDKLGIRLPMTLTYLAVTEQGDIVEAHQYGTNVMPGYSLVWYKTGSLGAVPQGVSFLRPAYKHWLLRDKLERVDAQAAERNGLGIPTVTLPEGATEKQEQDARQSVKRWRAGDEAGLVLPHGSKVELVGVSGVLHKTLDSIRYHDGQIAKAAQQNFLELSSSSKGSHSLGEVLIDLYVDFVQGLGNTAGEQFSDQCFRRIAEWNFGAGAAYPRLVCGEVGKDSNLPPEALALLVTSGIITADNSLEVHVRQEYDFPEMDEPREHVTPHVDGSPAMVLPTAGGSAGGKTADQPGSANFSAAPPGKVGAVVQAADTRTDASDRVKADYAAVLALAAPHSATITSAIQSCYPSAHLVASAASDAYDPDSEEPQADTAAIVAALTLATGVAAVATAIGAVHSDAATAGATAAATEAVTTAVAAGDRVSDLAASVSDAADGIDATTQSRVTAALVDGLGSGDSLEDLAAAVDAIFTDSDRADTIAETEAFDAYNSAKLDTFEAASVPQLWWETDPNLNNCQICVDNQTHSPVPLSAGFETGPPPLHPKCGCIVYSSAP